MSDVTQIVRRLHNHDLIPHYSTADLLMPIMCHVPFIPADYIYISKPRIGVGRTVDRRPRQLLSKSFIKYHFEKGSSVKSIADELGVSEKTVRNYANMYDLTLPGKHAQNAEFLRENADEVVAYFWQNGLCKTSKYYGIHRVTIKSFMERRK